MNASNEVKHIIGVQGVQGAGKTYLSSKLCENRYLEPCASISLDDFYFPFQELKVLSTKNKLWYGRGNPGTHDMKLLKNCLERFKNNQNIAVPIFNKYKHNGQGDRVGWKIIKNTTKTLILEGWCVGFIPVSIPLNADMEQINEKLYDFIDIYRLIDGFIILKVPDYNIVYKWRLEAEVNASQSLELKNSENNKLKNKDDKDDEHAMTKHDVFVFLQRYIPSYELYLENMYNNPPIYPFMIITLDENRHAVKVEVKKNK